MEGSLTDLSRYRLATAREDLSAAKTLFNEGMWKPSINRSYYSIFHALRSVTALDGFDAKKHSGIIAYFNQHYIKSGILGEGLFTLINEAFKFRENADYQDFYIASKEDAQTQIENAEKLLSIVEPYLAERWG